MARRVLAVSVICLVFLFMGVDLSYSQVTNITNDTITPIEGSGHDYIKMLSETVNPANGGLNVRIELPVPKSRGLTIPFSITYDSNNVHHLVGGHDPGSWGSTTWQSNTSILGQGGWTFAVPQLSLSEWEVDHNDETGGFARCNYASNYVLLDKAGMSHALGVGSYTGSALGVQYVCNAYLDPSVPQGSDGKVRANLTTQDPTYTYQWDPAVVVSDDMGTVYSFAVSPGNDFGNGTYVLPTSIEDRNGNIARFAITPSKVLTVTDSSGRTSISTNGFGPSGSTNTIVLSGEAFQVTWRTVSASYSTPFNDVSGNHPNYSCAGIPAVSGSQTVISQITLPNGRSYQFYYGTDITPHGATSNPYGLLSEIDYPSGAWATYSWRLSDTYDELAIYPGVWSALCPDGFNTCPQPAPNGCYDQYKNPVVASRRVSFGGSSPALTQTFDLYSTTWASGGKSWTTKATNVTTTDNVIAKSSLTKYSYQSINVPAPPYNDVTVPLQVAVEQMIQYYDWNNTTNPIRTVNKTWQDQFNPILEQTVYETGISAKTTISYTSSTGFTEPQQVNEFDFGANSPSRITATNYQSFSGANGYIGGAACQVLVCSAGTSCTATSSNKVAETDYLYDGGTAVCGASGSAATSQVSNLASGTHDETKYQYTSTTPRANLTRTIQWLSGGSSPTVSYTYDKTGQLLTTVDPAQNTTTYSYTDTYSTCSGAAPPSGNTNAYLTQVTRPPTSGVSHIKSFCYGYTDGQLRGSTDENGQVTTYQYSDVFARPTQISYPDTGLTTISYNDAPFNLTNNTPSITTSRSITSTVVKTTTAAIDGAGHIVRTLLTTDRDGTDITDATYDGFGRPRTQSNPHRSSALSTDGITTYNYDSLGRVVSVQKPDGSVVNTSYSGNTTTVTDETLKKRTAQADGLGRLTSVIEDPSPGSNYVTNYSYDVLDNLLCVEQHGNASGTGCSADPGNDATSPWRIRRFTYDSLFRLTTSKNPESGAINYFYTRTDGTPCSGDTSVMCRKRAPKPNQTGSSTVTTFFTYDSLNRVIMKSYDDSTPIARYGYDGTALSGCTTTPPTLTDSNPKDTRTSMCDGSGATSWKHDSRGRVLQEKRTILGTSAITNTISYAYNLDGSLATTTYPNTGKAVSYVMDGSGRPIALKDYGSIINYVQGSHYAPFGGLTSMTYGDTPITITNAYNNSLQPIRISASSPSATIMDLCYDFHSGIAVSSGTCSFPAYTSGDNGNVFQIVNKRDNNRTQNFTYDSMNRITQGNSTGSSWGETFTIDAWGNLTNRGPVAGKTNYEPLSAAPASVQNRLPGFSYDAAGNMTVNGSATYTYDGDNRLTNTAGYTYTYDGDGKRVKKCNACTSASGGTLYWRGIGSDPISESDLAGTVQKEYIFFAGQRVARRDVPGTFSVKYYFSDHLGSTSLITNATGAMPPLEESDYYPYGGEIAFTSGDPNQYKFTGQERDIESNLDYFFARSYASNTARFMSADVIGGRLGNPQTLNRYAYVINNPLRFLDPWGLQDVQAGTNCGVNEPGGPVVCDTPPAPSGTGAEVQTGTFDIEGTNNLSELDPAQGGSGQSSLSGNGTAFLGATQFGLDAAGLIPGPIGMAANVASAGISIYQGHYGQAALSLAFALPVVGQIGKEGYETFRAFKLAEGVAQEGMQWHHIVEQTASNIERFGPRAIHNVENLVQVPRELHIGEGSVSAFYSSKQAFSEGMTVRQWLSPQCFEAQREFGLQVLRDYGIIVK